MKVSREQVAEHRHRILDAAARLYREKGLEGVSVAQIMAAAGLTHGGFYGHFKSKEDLIAQALAHVLSETKAAKPPGRTMAAYAAAYLDRSHCDARAEGCPFAALGSEAVRGSQDTRAVLTRSLREQIEDFSATAPGETLQERRRAAIAGWAAMVGALILARIADDPALSDEILEATLRQVTAP
ncbi:TetR family transcriptional regulator [Labrys sp. LIt4]|uniref:TetR/AcrR family transcriptional regulator n=1 Tax=Labrys sp. LIt4 TaxID=2821355 RepID=UPI001ADF6261|nr:TetR family transcriptional regulator [Labrys sp. LIt4]MBP0582361.1 TetR family transcriptional regulator [Labrys sp. LIt4]